VCKEYRHCKILVLGGHIHAMEHSKKAATTIEIDVAVPYSGKLSH
jgi:hypothetical protein